MPRVRIIIIHFFQSEKVEDMQKVFKSSILAGIFIAVAGYIYLTVSGIVGACMFAFGLLGVCYIGLHLYTGKAGSVSLYKSDDIYYPVLGWILLFNVVGTTIVALMLSVVAGDGVISNLQSIINNRLNATALEAIIKAIFCGFIMEMAVFMYKKNTPLGILFGVPLFILCGFYHSIADSFYYALYLFHGGKFETALLVTYLLSIFGNLLGCNVRRIFVKA